MKAAKHFLPTSRTIWWKIVTFQWRESTCRIIRRFRFIRCRRLLTRKGGAIIQNGPFKGMNYLATATGSSLLPKLAGTYEAELFPVIERLSRNPYGVILNIGCAEGYYAVGMAIKIQSATVIAYDLDSNAQSLCRNLAYLNKVNQRVVVKGKCDSEVLNQDLGVRRALLIVDCEGGEMELIDPIKSPRLKDVDLIIEMHDFITPGVSKKISERLNKSHTLTTVCTRQRTSTELAALEDVEKFLRDTIIDEGRPCEMSWLIAESNSEIS
jgi:precorrin-6B methylase 2